MSAPPKHRKPWYRTRNLVLAILVALLAWVALWFRAAMYPTATISIDYVSQLEQLSATGQPPGEDMWPLLVELTQRYFDAIGMDWDAEDYEPDEALGFDFEDALRGNWDSSRAHAEFLTADRLLDGGVFDLLSEASTRPRCVHRFDQPETEAVAQLFTEHIATRVALDARLLILREAVKHGDATPQDIVAGYRDILGVLQGLCQSPLYIYQLAAWEQLGRTLAEMRYGAVEGQYLAMTCRGLLALLEQMRPLPPAPKALESERLVMLDVLQRIYTDDGEGGGRLIVAEMNRYTMFGLALPYHSGLWWPDDGRERSFHNLLARTLPSRSTTTDLLHQVFDLLVQESERTPVERARATFDLNQLLSPLQNPDASILGEIAGAWDQIADRRDWIEAELRATRIILALETHRLDHGEHPNSLNELVPGTLAALPFDPTHGGAFLYKRLQDDPHGRVYLLYSTGIDERDDGGQMPPADGSRLYKVLCDPEYAGFDYVFNRPRPGHGE